jgi:hypothetical protein
MQEEEEREDEEAVRLAGGIDAYIPGKKNIGCFLL